MFAHIDDLNLPVDFSFDWQKPEDMAPEEEI